MSWLWLCASVAVNGVLLIKCLRERTRAILALREAAATRAVEQMVLHEVERKFGTKKATRLAGATLAAVQQRMRQGAKT